MLERDRYRFLDCSSLVETKGIEERATEKYIRQELQERFPQDVFEKVTITRNDTGKYQGKFTFFDKLWGSGEPITELPKYYEIEIHHRTGEYVEELIVWSPVAWNERFAGTAGGGTGIGGRTYLTKPNNTTRGWTVPFAVMNGFTAATIYAGNIEGFHDYILNKKTGKFSHELYENWRVKSTHNMTVFGKAIAEILHARPVLYSYMNGGSGGGRQSMMEVQNYPDDYDGVWASCPAINWNSFLLGGLWPIVVMNEHQNFLNAKKNQFFIDEMQKSVGGKEVYYTLSNIPEFDAASCIGRKSPGGIITEKDVHVMNEIWKGPHKSDGTRLWYGFYPGVKNWQVFIPIGTYYYPLFSRKRIKEFILGTYHARWITGDPNQKFKDIRQKQYEELFEKGTQKFADTLGDNPAIDAFVKKGGKLLIDHGIDDPLIPVEGTIDYYQKLCSYFKGKDKVDEFCKLYITPGDNHGNCWGNGPGITESDGLLALMNWVEQGMEPKEIRKIQVDKKTGTLIKEEKQMPY